MDKLCIEIPLPGKGDLILVNHIYKTLVLIFYFFILCVFSSSVRSVTL